MQVYVLKEILLKGITDQASTNITKLHYWIENFVKTRSKDVKCTAMVRGGCVLNQKESNMLKHNLQLISFLHLWNVPVKWSQNIENQITPYNLYTEVSLLF